MSLLEVRGLEVSFDITGGELHAVQGVDFSLDPGERLGLVGESGSGKTTTILALMGLLPPNASVTGDVRLAGTDLLSGGERGTGGWRWSEVATVFQGAMSALNPIRTVGWQITEPMIVHGTAWGAAARSRMRDLLSLVGLAPAIERSYPHELSGGMRQRAAIAMALACEPKVLLADEPTTALDVVVQASILDLLGRLTAELGLALVLVTHDLAAATATCDRLAVMYAGRFVEEGPAGEMARMPEHPYTRRLFAATPDLFGNRIVLSIPGAPPRLDRPIEGCPFAPRCDVSFERCAERPALRPVAAGRRSACHRSVPAGDDAGTGNAEAGPAGRGGAIAQPDAYLTPGAPVHGAGAPADGAGPPADDGAGESADGSVLRLDEVCVAFPRRRGLGDVLRSRPRLNVRAVDGISLRLRAGEMVAIVGESGSGKTSTAHAIVGNVATTRGSVEVAGRSLAVMDRHERRGVPRRVQLIYQDPYESLDPRMRVRAILNEPLRVNRIGKGRRDRQRLAAEALSRVGLDPPELFADRFPHELSGGQRQRVAIAAALVMRPAIIVADEPVSMLDVSVRAEVLDVLDMLRRTESVAVLMITHDLSTAAHYADRICVMYLGRIVEEGPASEVVSAPRHPYTRALIAAVPGADRAAAARTLLPGEIPDGSAIPAGCRFHPRCPLAIAQCQDHDPQLVIVGADHAAACPVAS